LTELLADHAQCSTCFSPSTWAEPRKKGYVGIGCWQDLLTSTVVTEGCTAITSMHQKCIGKGLQSGKKIR